MPRHPRLRGREVINALQQVGFTVERVRDSHHSLSHPDGRATVVPVHSDETIGRVCSNRILRAVELSNEEFLKLL